MCADAKMMRLLAAEIRAEISARKQARHSGETASLRKTIESASAGLSFKQRLRERLHKTLASSSRQAVGH